MKLTVTIITHNEQGCIERCLRSIAPVADEIVVVDSYSTDRTVEICREHNCKVYSKEFIGFGPQKRFATSKSENNMILSLDADEELSHELLQSIATVKANGAEADAYCMNRLNYYCDKPIRHCGWYPDRQLRMFNRDKADWNSNMVHETVDISQCSTVTKLKGDILHHTCDSIEEHRAKEKRYAQINADTLIKSGKRIYCATPYLKGVWRWFKTYIIQCGILDGYYGLVISNTLAHSSYLKYRVAYIKNKN